MEFYQDCTEGVVKSLRCSAAKHPVRNEQYVVGHCHSAIGSHFGQWTFPFNVLYHCSQDIRVVRAVYGSTRSPGTGGSKFITRKYGYPGSAGSPRPLGARPKSG
ncbi:hypothetical protein TNCV_1589361 [Trichonephila clavipes]|uniref:Uncharacterized protein n=1 Tax=Trichonephila clavipes TaxID=2585209 RepID=A0A8X6RGM1_TRICX|nr:hypothetical protein TNCV_1589361 [Trichonephila clavipes]